MSALDHMQVNIDCKSQIYRELIEKLVLANQELIGEQHLDKSEQPVLSKAELKNKKIKK